MNTTPTIPVPRATYGLIMGLSTMVAGAAAWLLAAWLGADALTLKSVVIASGLGALATAAPVVLSLDRDRWGVFVMGAGVARMLLSLGYCYAAREATPELMARPLFVGVVAGAMLLLIVEVTVSIKILSALDQRRAGAAATGASSGKLA